MENKGREQSKVNIVTVSKCLKGSRGDKHLNFIVKRSKTDNKQLNKRPLHKNIRIVEKRCKIRGR